MVATSHSDLWFKVYVGFTEHMLLCRTKETHPEGSTSTMSWPMQSNKNHTWTIFTIHINHMMPDTNHVSLSFEDFSRFKTLSTQSNFLSIKTS